MSSLRNAVKRVTHKERSQPTNRNHLGILEKKKDYRIRSNDYHRKQDELARLRKLASFRNPDEFYFGMHKSQVKDGKHRKAIDTSSEEMQMKIGAEAVKLMKTQDLNYVRMQVNVDKRKLERLKSSLQFLGDNPYTCDENGTNTNSSIEKSKKHTIFVDDVEKSTNFNVADHFDCPPQLAGRAFNRIRKEDLAKSAVIEQDLSKEDQKKHRQPSTKDLLRQSKYARKQARSIAKARSSAYKEMLRREKRMSILKNTEAHLITEKIVQSKGRKRKISGKTNDGKPAVYVFSRKRAR